MTAPPEKPDRPEGKAQDKAKAERAARLAAALRDNLKRRKAAQLIRDTAVDKEPEAKEEPAEAKEEAAE